MQDAVVFIGQKREHQPVGFLEPLQREDEQFGVVFVGEWRERDGREAATLEPVHSRGVDGDSLLGGDVWSVLQVVVLSLLLSLQVEPRQTPQVLLAHCLVDGGASSDSLAVVVRSVGPPISLGLHVSQDHVLDGCGEAGHLPRDVGLPAAPRLGQVLQDGPRLVLFDSFRHHVQDVVHYLKHTNSNVTNN